MYWISVLLGPDSFSFSHGWSRIITGLFFMSRIIELSNFSFHTECHGISRIYISCPELSNYRIFLFHTECHGLSRFFFIPNYRIIEFFFSHGMSRSSHGSFLSRIIELSNFSFSHGVPRRITDLYFLSRIIELSNYSSHGVPRRITDLFFCPEFANSKIRDKEKHPWYSVTFRVKRKNRDSPWLSVWRL